MRHPYGIWNPWQDDFDWDLWSHYETSLWDLKPAKTKMYDANNKDYETSLWDLKRSSKVKENEFGGYYETSLWDLKQDLMASTVFGRVRLWDIPMGFETTMCKPDIAGAVIMRHPYGIWNPIDATMQIRYNKLWDIPMGFETRSKRGDRNSTRYYETSLWDLKLVLLKLRVRNTSELWDIPMGFETYINLQVIPQYHIMRHPYGIWNFNWG